MRAAAAPAAAPDVVVKSRWIAPPARLRVVERYCWTMAHHAMATAVFSHRLPAGQPDTLGGRNGCWPIRSRSCQLRSTVDRSKPRTLAPLTTRSIGVLALA